MAFDFAIVACLIAAVASLLRGKRYVHEEHSAPAETGNEIPEPADNPGATVAAEPVFIAEEAEESTERRPGSRQPALRLRRER